MKRIRKKLSSPLHAMKGIGRNIEDAFLDILLPCTGEAYLIGCIIYCCVAGGVMAAIMELLKLLWGR